MGALPGLAYGLGLFMLVHSSIAPFPGGRIDLNVPLGQSVNVKVVVA